MIDNYNDSMLNILCWIFFCLASFASTVTALNMIIAIMSDTFSKVTQSFDLYTRTMKIWILIDYQKIIQKQQNRREKGADGQLT